MWIRITSLYIINYWICQNYLPLSKMRAHDFRITRTSIQYNMKRYHLVLINDLNIKHSMLSEYVIKHLHYFCECKQNIYTEGDQFFGIVASVQTRCSSINGANILAKSCSTTPN